MIVNDIFLFYPCRLWAACTSSTRHLKTSVSTILTVRNKTLFWQCFWTCCFTWAPFIPSYSQVELLPTTACSELTGLRKSDPDPTSKQYWEICLCYTRQLNEVDIRLKQKCDYDYDIKMKVKVPTMWHSCVNPNKNIWFPIWMNYSNLQHLKQCSSL